MLPWATGTQFLTPLLVHTGRFVCIAFSSGVARVGLNGIVFLGSPCLLRIDGMVLFSSLFIGMLKQVDISVSALFEGAVLAPPYPAIAEPSKFTLRVVWSWSTFSVRYRVAQ